MPASVPPGQGTPKNFRPQFGLAVMVRELRAMIAQLAVQDVNDKAAGKPVNEKRKRRAQVLTECVALCNDVRFTGAVADYWLTDKRFQAELPLNADPTPQEAPPQARSSSFQPTR